MESLEVIQGTWAAIWLGAAQLMTNHYPANLNLPHIHPIHNSQPNFWSYGQDKKEAQLNKIQRFRKLKLR